MQAIPLTVTSLTMAGCDLLHGKGLARLTQLQSLHLSSCPRVTPAAIQVPPICNPRHITRFFGVSTRHKCICTAGLTLSGSNLMNINHCVSVVRFYLRPVTPS